MIVWILFICSLFLNIFGFFYVRWLLRNLAFSTEGLKNIWDIVGGFTDHVKAINELEMFYGDETLASLIRHGTEATAILDEYRSTFQIFDEDSIEGGFIEEKEK